MSFILIFIVGIPLVLVLGFVLPVWVSIAALIGLGIELIGLGCLFIRYPPHAQGVPSNSREAK
jgi:hypothetical protein